jgi:hypothetical protein
MFLARFFTGNLPSALSSASATPRITRRWFVDKIAQIEGVQHFIKTFKPSVSLVPSVELCVKIKGH